MIMHKCDNEKATFRLGRCRSKRKNMDYRLVPINDIGRLESGTHIVVERSCQRLRTPLNVACVIFTPQQLYRHHGVYLPDLDNQVGEVIHFYGETEEAAKPTLCSLDVFRRNALNDQLYRVEYLAETVDVETTQSNARYALDIADNWREYNIADYNCESFAHWLKTGRVWSAQVNKVLKHILGWSIVVVGFSIMVKAMRRYTK